ncbi:Ferredoxin subunit of nitrite reductase or a ring-hydroxylating dioxygenase [bacterium A37T11]|nr:Ferredoxin subunit of nitrite reductase or a ring-hydroxylating dioxygenase [bacterium A37T11]
MVTRRKFIKSSCAACIGMMGSGLLLEACASRFPLVKLTPSADQMIHVPLTSFLPESNMIIVRSKTLENDILLRKTADGYKALYLHCTHEGVALTPTPEKIFCHAHGSVFNLDGQVVQDPATDPLKQFKAELSNNEILIHIS